MGRKCGILDCLSDSSREEDRGVTFHKIPMHPDIRPKWMSLCRIPDDKKLMKVVYVCSRHFLKVDFCHFKGKKYMLKQGVLPSVFPWNKSNKIHVKSEDDDFGVKIKNENEDDSEPNDDNCDIKPEIKLEVSESDFNASTSLTIQTDEHTLDLGNIKEEVLSPNQSTTIEQKLKTIETATGSITFAPNTRIEALDFNQLWCPAKIVEVDYQENEVLVHFEKYSNKYDEWICMNSLALRALKTNKKHSCETYTIGERCLASWSDARKFPATISRVLDKDSYEVSFDDGFVKTLKGHRIAKVSAGKHMQSAPLFDPVTGSKQERRDRKRKINVAALFGKRIRTGSQDDKLISHANESLANSLSEEPETWTPKWDHGRPIGEDSVIETSDGPRKSVIVNDPRLPPHWVKHLAQRIHGAFAGKWDTLIVNPDGRRFRTRNEIKSYIEENPELNLKDSMFDFSICRRSKKSTSDYSRKPIIETSSQDTSLSESLNEEEGESSNSLKIPVVDNSYKCPIEGCGKNFRRENLAQMHVKHYHPEYTKFLDSTPNVADLAYARTVGESLDRSPGPEKITRLPQLRQAQKTLTNKAPILKLPSPPCVETEHQIKIKDSEIIKLLSSKSCDGIKKEEQRPLSPILPSGLPPSMYPDIKLKDLLIKSEAIPKRDDLNLKTLSASTQRPTGIKTLLPILRQEIKTEDSDPESQSKTPVQNKIFPGKYNLKRKRIISENAEQSQIKPKELQEIPTTSDIVPKVEPNNVIIEGGEVIKIVQMKREEIINCTCGITEEDGLMIQCELCLCWQHAYCNNIERESQVPDKYICYICQNPVRQRSSKKYFHDQDWLKHGSLPIGNYHCKDEQVIKERIENLKRSHDLSGALVELKDYLHTLKVKIKVADVKNHPKLYLWSKQWEKLPLPEKMEGKDENENTKLENEDHQYSKNGDLGESMLLSLLKSGKTVQKLKDEGIDFPRLDLNTLMENNLEQLPVSAPIIPQPEAAIDSEDCRLNLLEHISHSQSLVEERLNDFEAQINKLDPLTNVEDDNEEYPKLRETTQMIMRDLNILKELSQMSTF